MAACSKTQLIADACANGFVGLTPELIKAIELQLLCNLSQSGGGGGGGGIGGAQALAAGVSSGTVVFANPFASAPTAVVPTVQDSSGAQVLFASPVTITNTGFTFNLSGVTESVNLSLHYTAIE